MAMNAKDGTRHHSASRARMHDMIAAEKPAAKPAMGGGKPAPAGDESGEGSDISHMPIHEAVAKHGPAEEVHIKHDREGNTHHVHSVHSGKNHHSEHKSAHEAYDHAMMAADAEPEEETPDEETETPNEANEDLSGENESEEPEHAGVPGIGR